ncbi:FxsA family protein [Dongia sp.]|uniref:FxsA family protein n=1 Tax=Dongia sp. TaxID=1977262 RepID=UPI0035AEF624
MIRLLTVLILLLPLLEIAGFVVIGGRIGLGPTLLWVLAAALGGIGLIRQGGLNAVTKLQTAMNERREPGHSLIDGAVIVIAGLLLVVPGFVSDFLALFLLLPWTRNFLLRRMARHFETRVYRGQGAGSRGPGARTTTIIEGEFEVVEPAADDGETPEKDKRPGGWRKPPQIIDQSDDQT